MIKPSLNLKRFHLLTQFRDITLKFGTNVGFNCLIKQMEITLSTCFNLYNECVLNCCFTAAVTKSILVSYIRYANHLLHLVTNVFKYLIIEPIKRVRCNVINQLKGQWQKIEPSKRLYKLIQIHSRNETRRRFPSGYYSNGPFHRYLLTI